MLGSYLKSLLAWPVLFGLLFGVLFGVLIPVASAQETDTQPSEAPWSMADKYWGKADMAASRKKVQAMNGGLNTFMIMADRLEVQSSDDEETLIWDAQGWYGGDVNKLYLKSEGEVSLKQDKIEDAELQALWSRAMSPFWDIQAGVRQDFEPKGRTHAVLGVHGLAPYWFEVDAAAFISTNGDVSARIEGEYDLRLTQRMVLQPRAEIELSAQNIPELEIGSGLTGIHTGIRLRYEFKRELAPYIGVEWQGHFGKTRDFIKAAGGQSDQIVAVAGLRAWF